MKTQLEKIFGRLPASTKKYVVYFEDNIRIKKSWAALSGDIDHLIRILETIRKRRAISLLKIGIIGPISYSWMAIDLACLKGGFRATGLPEHFAPSALNDLVVSEELDIVLADQVLSEKTSEITAASVYYFNCRTPDSNDIQAINVNDREVVQPNILAEFGAGFTSGTTRGHKRITMVSVDTNDPKPGFIERALTAIVFPFTFWSRSDNKVIIFMPFSHIQQRTLVKMALLNNINIIISNEINVIRHIITERPNIMVSVPVIYEMIAGRIREKTSQFSPVKKKIYALYKALRINRSSNWNPIKLLMDQYLFHKIRKLYGGRADYFIVGSAKVNTQTVRTFYDVGVRILEAYGQSETGIISMSSHWNFKIGSVGKPGPYVKIAPDGEILLKFNELYYHDYNKDILTVDEDNYIHTGDVGYLDKKGYLFLKGRKDEVIVLESGLKVFAADIELRLKACKGVQHAVVFSDTGRSLKAIISAEPGCGISELVRSVGLENKKMSKHERITELAVDYTPWSPESGHITNTLKIKRNKIIEDRQRYSFNPIPDRTIVAFDN